MEDNHIKQIKQIIRVLVQDYGLELNASLWGKMSNVEDTPLEYLIGGGCPMPECLIQFLVDLGARLDTRDRNGHNPLVRYLWLEEKSINQALKLRHQQKRNRKGIHGEESSSETRPETRPSPITSTRTLRALIEACCWANIRLDEKYSWGEKQLTLRQILGIRFSWSEPPERLENNRGSWKDFAGKFPIILYEEQMERYEALGLESGDSSESESDENSESEL